MREFLTWLELLVTEKDNLKVSPDGIKNLIGNLKNNKSPGPDLITIWKCEMLIDPDITASCVCQQRNTNNKMKRKQCHDIFLQDKALRRHIKLQTHFSGPYTL